MLLALCLLAVGLVAAAPASADSRCGGARGYQAWQDSGLNGVSFIRCVNVSNLTTVDDNIAIGDWNDRISSWQTFNASSNYTCVYENASYGWSVASRNSRILGNNTLSTLTSTANDRGSSVKMGVTSSACPTS